MRVITIIASIIIFTFGFCALSIADENKETKEIDALGELQAAADYFHNIGIGELNTDIKIIFDPSGSYKKKDIEKWNIPKSVYPWIGHYYYKDGGIFQFKVFGEVIARNDAETAGMQSTIVVPLIPLPGGIMCGESVLERYSVSYKGELVQDGHPCNIIKLEAINRDDEFFSFIEYYIDKEDKIIRKVECAFELGYWAGSAEGEFFYKKKRGKLMPNVGHGTVYFRKPYSRLWIIWGKWSGFDMKSLDEIARSDEDAEKK